MSVEAGGPRAEIRDGITHRGECNEPHVTAWRVFAELPGEGESVHPRHAQVTQNKVRAAINDQSSQPLFAIGRDSDVGSEVGQQDPGELAVVRVILDDEYLDAAQGHGEPRQRGKTAYVNLQLRGHP